MHLIVKYIDRVIVEIKNGELEELLNSPFYKIVLKKYVAEIGPHNELFLKLSLSYVSVKKLLQAIKSSPATIDVEIEDSVTNFIQDRELYLQTRAKMGLEIRCQDSKYNGMLLEFSKILSDGMVRELRPKQLWDSFYMTTMRRSCNFSVPGSGKTSAVYGMFCFLKQRGLVDQILVICPKNAFGPWIDEYKYCFGDKEQLHLFNIQSKELRNVAQKRAAVKYDSAKSNLLLFNYESIKSLEGELGTIINKRTLLVFDEAHKIKRVSGEYAKTAIRLAQKAYYVAVMTGTPIPNTYQDIFNVLQILFQDEYNEYFGYSPVVLKNPSEAIVQGINHKLQPFFCRTNKEQLGVPPANTDMILPVASTDKEQQLFNIVYLKHKKNKLLLMLRLLQMESNPKMLLSSIDLSEYKYIINDEVENVDEVDYADYSEEVLDTIESISITSKTKQCLDLVKGIVKQGKSVIVWCIFVDTIRYLSELLNNQGYLTYSIYGEVDLDNRNAILSSFKNGEFNVLITNPNTLAESISLHSVCHDAIYFEYSFNLVHLLQSKDRIHRLGLNLQQYTQFYFLESFFSNSVNYYSMDEQIYIRLKEKELRMKKAIDASVLEVLPSSEEELDLIFSPLQLT